MPRRTKEKKKCMEKLNEMSRFLPFLDFMIKKIKKANNEISLSRQLSKFQVLRSMIFEKKKNYPLEVVLKVEEVILKLIAKLNYEDPYINRQKENSQPLRKKEKNKHSSRKTNRSEKKSEMATAVSIIPSSTTTTLSVTHALSSPAVTTVDSRPQGSSTNTVDLIMKTLKLSVQKKDNNENENHKEYNLNSSDSSEHLKKKGDSENELDKDLQNYELPEYSGPKEESNKKFPVGKCLVSKEVSSQGDILSSSREKLMKSLQKKLPFSRSESTTREVSKCSQKDVSNFDDIRYRSCSDDFNIKSAALVSKHAKDDCAFAKHSTKSSESTEEKGKASLAPKSFHFDSLMGKKTLNDAGSNLSNFNSKQRLREKLSADICEVYRVAGKSVGGSLRSLKERRNSIILEEEDELFKPDKIIEIRRRSTSEITKQQSHKQLEKSAVNIVRSDNYKKRNEIDKKKNLFELSTVKEEKHEESKGNKNGKTSESQSKEKEKKSEGAKETKTIENCDSQKKEKVINELDNLSDNELSEFLKENMLSLPHLSTLKQFDLKKEGRLSLLASTGNGLSDTEPVSEDSLEDLDEFMNEDYLIQKNLKSPESFEINQNQEKKEEKVDDDNDGISQGPFSNVKISQEKISDQSAKQKNIFPIFPEATEEFGKLDDKIKQDIRAKKEFAERSIEETSQEYAENLIEKTTPDFSEKLTEKTKPEVTVKKKKGLLELPLPWSDDLFDAVSSDDSNESLINYYNSRNKKSRHPQLTPNSSSCSTIEKKGTFSKCDKKFNDVELSPEKRFNAPVAEDGTSPYSPTSPCINYNIPRSSTDNSCRTIKNSKVSEIFHTDNKNESWNIQPIYLPQNLNPLPQFNISYPLESNDPKFYNVGTFHNQFPTSICYVDPSRHNACYSSEPKSYAEYKRMKQREQEKLQQQEILAKEKLKDVVEENLLTNKPVVSPAKKNESENNSEKNIESLSNKSENAPGELKNSKNILLNVPEKFSAVKPKDIGKRRDSEKIESRFLNDFEKKRKGFFQEIRKMEEEKNKKLYFEAQNSTERDEIISPLEQLYQNETKPKTGRGYGLQNFKIPRKSRESDIFKKSDDNQSLQKETNHLAKDISQVDVQNVENESKKNFKNEIESQKEKLCSGNSYVTEGKANSNRVDEISNIPNESAELAADSTEMNSKEKEKKNNETKKVLTPESTRSIECDPKNIASNLTPDIEIKTDLNNSRTDELNSYFVNDSIDSKEISDEKNNTIEKGTDEKIESETSKCKEEIKKCETEIVECDSSIEGVSSANTSNSEENKEQVSVVDKNTVSTKEEITQEFVESLIKKCFQSGEGQLLLAQAKLFEKLTRKLNSKKLKTLKKIIDSESDSSSSTSSSSESSSDDEKLKKNKKFGKAVEKKSLKKKKKKKKIKRNRILLITSSSESEENDKIEKKTEGEKKENSVKAKDRKSEKEFFPSGNSSADDKSESSDFSDSKTCNKNKRKSKTMNSTRKKSQRKQDRKNILEEISKGNSSEKLKSDSPAPETPSNEIQQKSKPKTKSKQKSELDRLHEDIKSMFISSGVVTATGQRICRILKESGGNINNVDIVKESAKMVKEEKLKKKGTRSSPRNSQEFAGEFKNSNSTSEKVTITEDPPKSKTLESEIDKGESVSDSKNENDINSIEFSEILKRQPYILLQRVDLNNFGYGVKISDNCLSFSRLQGRNVALRGKKLSKSYRNFSSNVIRNPYLPRNKRKFERMKNKKSIKSYTSKKLMEVIKKLPLKIAKMKHLELCAQNNTDGQKGKIERLKLNCDERKKRAAEKKADFRTGDLLNYAFDRKTVLYPCRLCSHITRNITSHYKSTHPDSEVLISRLNKAEARRAIAESKSNGYNLSETETPCTSDAMKEKTTSTNYLCRMCNCPGISGVNSFLGHIGSHTGEHRYNCPAEGCLVTMSSLDHLKNHISTKHLAEKVKLHDKIVELFPEAPEPTILFGFICSECNFLQLSRNNVQTHIEKNHPLSKRTKIIKIDLCRKVEKKSKSEKNEKNKKAQSCLGSKKKENSLGFLNINTEKRDGTEIEKSIEEINGETSVYDLMKKEENVQQESTWPQEEENGDNETNSLLNDGSDSKESKEDASPPKNFFNIKCDEEFSLSSDENQTENIENVENKDKVETESTSAENLVELKDVSSAKEADVVVPKKRSKVKKGMRSQKATSEKTYSNNGFVFTLRVGYVQAQILGNSGVLYKCCVKKCSFTAKEYDSFEKHIKIIHPKVKWNGYCVHCVKNPVETILPIKLISALKHLRQHESSKTALNVNTETEGLRKSPFNETVDCENSNSFPKSKLMEPLTEKISMPSEVESEKDSFPVKPLLRVRNFLGDRLSRSKDLLETNEVVDIPEEKFSETDLDLNPNTDSVMMFTIENVRTLKPEEEKEENELEINQVGLNQEELQKANSGPGKPILVRSCPTRQIPILPDSGTFPVEVGHVDVGNLKTIQTPFSTLTTQSQSHDMLAPLPSNSLGNVSISNYKVPLQPVKVTITSPFLNTSGAMSLIYSAPSSLELSSSALPVNLENKTPINIAIETLSETNQNLTPSNSSSDLGKTAPKSPRKRILQPNSPMLQRLQVNSGEGNKSVKDAKIHKEMLTKVKLCHLFKCMAVECSFTCNDENIFTQHLGLHEAQKRLQNQKSLTKTLQSENCNKMNKIQYWQQCAYCCEILDTKGSALSQHILAEHGHCIYQCAYCFYRAVSPNYVKIHQNFAHTQMLKNSSHLIYKCKPLSGDSTTNLLKEQFRKQSVRPYHCDRCGSNFYITQEFISHLTTKHQGLTGYTCHICKNLCFKADKLVVHYRLHSYCTYQCPYCLHGTETEKEMLFHFCNFHFSQPPHIYVRALAEGKNGDGSQMDSLKVIICENDPHILNCIIEADLESDIPNDSFKNLESLELSAIVAELGINENNESQTPVTPIIKELACIGKQSQENLTVESLLPNAKFSSEKECENENCDVLISSRLNLSSSEHNELDTPLSQLPIEPITVQTSTTNPLNKSVHKLPAMVLNKSFSRKVYAAKALPKPGKQVKENFSNTEIANSEIEAKSEKEKFSKHFETINKIVEEDVEPETTKNIQPLIIEVMSLAKEKTNTEGNSQKSDLENELNKSRTVSDASSLSNPATNLPFESVTRTPSKVKTPALEPPIIRVEDFLIVEDQPKNIESTANVNSDSDLSQIAKNQKEISGSAEEEIAQIKKLNKSEKNYINPHSPEVIILKETSKAEIETVTLDSEEEKEESTSEVKNANDSDETILKEMELLRNQITKETNSLLFDDTITSKEPSEIMEKNLLPEQPKILSPQQETVESDDNKLEFLKENEEKEKHVEVIKDEGTSLTLRKTRSGFREKVKKSKTSDDFEKSDSEENLTNIGLEDKDEKFKNKKQKEDLSGKDLYLCGNENCSFSAENDSLLKEHLHFCTRSRESSYLVCPHCSRSIKHFTPFVEHIKHHGEKKHHCGLCEFATAVENSILRHMRQKHKCFQYKKVAKDSGEEGHVAYYPKNYKIEKQDFEVNAYSPGDEDKLPRQSVYLVNVKCAKCPYFTKVRSNMVRHLKIHLKSVETEGGVIVPSTAPTNPVPCLDTKEKMFDKMTNLAASSQLAQAKEKTVIEELSPKDKAKLPQFVAEQLRYKCCLSDCNYITVDEGMLKHHMKALHDEINYYSCPHCEDTVHVDVRNVVLDKIGHHLKHHDNKLYKCAHCIYFHFQKSSVEKHLTEKHPDRRFYVHTVREPKVEASSEEEVLQTNRSSKIWKCGLCEEFQNSSKEMVVEHLAKNHNTKAKYRCGLCSVKSNNFHGYSSHFSSKHPGEKVIFIRTIQKVSESNKQEPQSCSSEAESSSDHFDTTPLWQRGAPRVRHIRGILIEEEEVKTKKRKMMSQDQESESENPPAMTGSSGFYCPLCSNKKPFFTRNENFFRSHLYQELNYNQFACILCGKMFVEKKDFEKHHNKVHPDKSPSFKQTKEDAEITFWVDKVILTQKNFIQPKKRKADDENSIGNSTSQAKKKKKSESPIKSESEK